MYLRNLRKNRKLSLQFVADILGISAMQLSRIERGIYSLKVPYAKKLAELYGVEWSKLYE